MTDKTPKFIITEAIARQIEKTAAESYNLIGRKGGIEELREKLDREQSKLSDKVMSLYRVAWAQSAVLAVRLSCFDSVCESFAAAVQALDFAAAQEKRPMKDIMSSWPVFKSQMRAALSDDISPVGSIVGSDGKVKATDAPLSLYDVHKTYKDRHQKAPSHKGKGSATLTPAAAAAVERLMQALIEAGTIGQDAIANKIIDLLASLAKPATVAEPVSRAA